MNLSKTLLLIIAILTFVSCEHRSTKSDYFDTTDAGELFFNNLRKSSYYEEENKEAGIRSYLHKDLSDTSFIKAQIVFNWRQDKAFFMISFDTMNDELKFKTPTDSIIFTGESMQNHLDCALLFYNSYQKKQNIECLDLNKSLVYIPEAFIISFKDFQQLVSKQ